MRCRVPDSEMPVPGRPGMIGDDVEAARLERPEDGPVHGRAIDAEMSEVVIVEHQGHEIEALCRELGRNGILERPRRRRDDRRGLDAGASEIPVAFGQGDGGRTRRARRHRRRRARRGGRMAVALGRGRGCGRPVGIARPALAINGARGPDRPGQQLGGVAAGRAEIERDDTGTNADEDQHLLRLAAQIVGAIGGAAIRARHDLLDLLRRQGRRTLLRRRCVGSEHQAAPAAIAVRKAFRRVFMGLSFAL